MNRIIVLGSAAAVAAPGHENTHLLIQAGGRTIMVDCPGSPIIRLNQAGIDPLTITDLFVTHFHPDHVSGLPLLLIDLWLLGRKEPLTIHGLAVTLDLVEKNLELYNWKRWPGFFPVNFNRHPGGAEFTLLENENLRFSAAEVCHLIPTLGLRLQLLPEGKTVSYSCDTQPCPAVSILARGVDVFLHEAAGPGEGHTSPAQAGITAAEAGAKSLYLIHYPPEMDEAAALSAAHQNFTGPVLLAVDFMEINLD
jgi:ribonuclease Z